MPVSWTIEFCLKESKPSYALQLFDQMLGLGVELDSVVLVTMAKACRLLKSISKGKWVYEVAERNGFFGKDDVLVGNLIVKMYLNCRRIEEARAMFEGMKVRDLVMWTMLISGYIQNGGFNDGLKLFRAMHGGGVRPDSFSVSNVLLACARMVAHNNRREIHGKIIRLHLGVNTIVFQTSTLLSIARSKTYHAFTISNNLAYINIAELTTNVSSIPYFTTIL